MQRRHFPAPLPVPTGTFAEATAGSKLQHRTYLVGAGRARGGTQGLLQVAAAATTTPVPCAARGVG